MTPPPSLQELIDTVRQDSRSDSALDQLVTAAAAVAQLEETSDALLGHFVDRCRHAGRTWSEISKALGVTKQAVHKRFATTLADQIIAATENPTLERFTARALSVLAAAMRYARASGPAPVSSAHVLLALYAEPEGVAAKVLRTMNVGEEGVRAALGIAGGEPGAAESGTGATHDDAVDSAGLARAAVRDFTPDGRQALRDALAVALELAHNYIGTEHLLIGLYRNPDSPAAAILAEAGTTEAQARAHVQDMLRGYRPPAAS